MQEKGDVKDHCITKKVHCMQTGTLMMVSVTRPYKIPDYFEADKIIRKLNK